MSHPTQSAVARTLWWVQTWWLELDGWLRAAFDGPLEVHAFLLGALVGVVLAALVAKGRLETMLTVASLALFVAFGLFDTALCPAGAAVCRHLRLEPQYLLAGVCLAYPLAFGGIRSALDDRSATDGRSATDAPRSVTLLAAGVVVGLLALALYSLAATTPVHPITGLATVGGFVGAALGRSAYEWARVDEGDGPGFRSTVRGIWLRDRDAAVFVVGYGTTLGFGYPRLYWELSTALGREGFLLGPISWARYGLPSVALYGAVIFVAHAGFLAVRRWRRGRRLGGTQFAALVLGHLAYGLCLFLATGLAVTVWDRVVF